MKIKTALIVFAFIVSNIITYLFATTDVVKTTDGCYTYSIVDALAGERELCNATFELLHRFYSNDDNDFWFDVVVNTKEYQKVDSLLNGDWEDFYYYTTDIMDYE